MDLKAIGEFGLIDRIREGAQAPDGIVGIGDDCALIPQKTGMSTLVTTDMLVEGTHFLTEDASAYDIGWKSAAVNISDIAAMGGRPVGSFLAFALPASSETGWVDEFMRGYRDVSALSGTALLGGDTTRTPDRMCICVTVVGECVREKAVLRSGARPGDLICVSGCLGDSAGGLRVILDGIERGDDESELVRRHYMPVPRVREGMSIAACGASAMMDISDGIGSDLSHILDASSVGAEIDCSLIPVSGCLLRCAAAHGWDVESLAVDGGEDFELLFTISPEDEHRLEVNHTVIGRILPGKGIRWLNSGGGRHSGYRHF